MPKVNPRVEQLEWEVKSLRRQIEMMRADPGDIPFTACDHSCVCALATGQATNGGCRCDERKLRRAVQWWRRRAQFLQTTIQDMKTGVVDFKEVSSPHPERGAKGPDCDDDCG